MARKMTLNVNTPLSSSALVLTLTLTLTLASLTLAQYDLNVPRPRCPTLFAWIRDPSDCARFWRCNWGSAILMPSCPAGTVLSQRYLVCVHIGGMYDDCYTVPTVLPETSPIQYPTTTTTTTTTTRPTTRTTTTTTTRPTTRTRTTTTTTRPPPPPPPTTTSAPSIWQVCSRNLTALAPHPQECQLFYNCSLQNGVVPRWALGEIYLTECEYPLVFDTRTQTCRPSYMVDCGSRVVPRTACDYKNSVCSGSVTASTPVTTRTPVTSVQTSSSTSQWSSAVADYCRRNSSALLPHPEECQLYYNCSRLYSVVPPYFEQYLQECIYPLLYDADARRCVEFTQVTCGRRKDAVTTCDYRQYRCSSASCTPCDQVMPECKGRGDGYLPLDEQRWTATYAMCLYGRLLNLSQCPVDMHLQVPQVFSPIDLQCVNLYLVPRGSGGLRPECAGQADGPYPEEHGRPDLFYVCSSGQLDGVYRCPRPRPVYDPVNKICSDGDPYINV